MPAGLPGATLAQNLANPAPATGVPVTFSPFSGPKGSPFDFDKEKVPGTWPPVAATAFQANGNASTGALSTGIGYALNDKMAGINTATLGVTLPAQQLGASGLDDDEAPGLTMPDGTAAADARLLAIGGGKSVATVVKAGDWSNTLSVTTPYVPQPLLAAGVGGSRDAGAGPAFTGFGMKMVTAAADVAAAGVIETGFVNRTGAVLKSGLSQFGSNSTASAAVT